MKTKMIVTTLLSLGVTLASSSVIAQYTGSSAPRGGFQGPGAASGQTVTVANVLRTPIDDQRVTLRGNIIRRIGGDK